MPPFSLDDEQADNAAPVENSSTSTPGVAEHAAEIIAASPEVQQHAVDEATRQRAAEESQTPVDDFGVKFDPKIHTGSKLKSGHWRTKKGASTLNTPKSRAATTPKSGELVMTAEQEQKARMAGAAAVSMMVASLTMFFGDEWQPRTEKQCGYDEEGMLKQAAGDYAVSKNWTDFPPGITFAFVSLGYIVARFQMPKTRQKVSSFKTWLALRIAKRKLKKEFKKAGIVANVEIKEGVLMVNGKANWNTPEPVKGTEKK